MTNYRSLSGGFYSSAPYDRSVPVSIRCNNPGAVNGAAWEQQMPGYVTTVETTPGNKTTIFEAPEQGVRVWYELLRKYKAAGAVTPRQIITRYGGGQDYSAYVDTVVKRSGLQPDAALDLEDDRKLLPFAKAMFSYEAGRTTPLSDAQILYGFALARGKAVSPAVSSTGFWSTIFSAVLAFLRGATATSGTAGAPAWYARAEKEIGFHEVGENRGIERYITAARCGSIGDPWCAIFVNAMLELSNIDGTRSAMARSFETDADFVKLSGPALGCIVTMWRGSPSSGSGHVFLYDGEGPRGVRGIAGNEDDGVRRAFHDRSRITGYWYPRSQPQPQIGAIHVDSLEAVGGSEV